MACRVELNTTRRRLLLTLEACCGRELPDGEVISPRGPPRDITVPDVLSFMQTHSPGSQEEDFLSTVRPLIRLSALLPH